MAAFGNYFGTIDPKAFRRFERSCCRWFGYLKNKTPTSEDTIVETEFSYLKPRCGSDDWTDEVKRFAVEFGPTPSGPKGDFFLHALVISPNAGQSFTVDEIVKAMSQATLKKYTNTPQHYYIRGVRAWQDHSFKCGYDSKNKEATATKIFDIQKCYDYGKES